MAALLGVVGWLRRHLSISDPLKDALTAEIIGGGVTALLIGVLLLYIQRRGENTEQIKSGEAFIEGTLIVDIYEAAKRGISPWNLGRGLNKAFYFDNTIINHLYSVVHGHSERISRYRQILPDAQILNLSRKVELDTRDGYVVGEQLDTILYQIIKETHHKLGVHPANDNDSLSYVKAKMFADLNDAQVATYMGWPQIGDHHRQVLEAVIQNENAKKHIEVLSKMRSTLVARAEELIQLAQKELKIP